MTGSQQLLHQDMAKEAKDTRLSKIHELVEQLDASVPRLTLKVASDADTSELSITLDGNALDKSAPIADAHLAPTDAGVQNTQGQEIRQPNDRDLFSYDAVNLVVAALKKQASASPGTALLRAIGRYSPDGSVNPSSTRYARWPGAARRYHDRAASGSTMGVAAPALSFVSRSVKRARAAIRSPFSPRSSSRTRGSTSQCAKSQWGSLTSKRTRLVP